MTAPIVLASASPRRRDILTNAGVYFRVVESAAEELTHAVEGPEALVKANALRKAQEVAAREHAQFVIGADTIVAIDDAVLGKPASLDEAQAMLRRLQGRTHQVMTGLALIAADAPAPLTAVETTDVTFSTLTDDDIAAYIRTFDPLDKAGAYAAQDSGALVIEGVRGCYYNVVGLPLNALERMFQSIGRSLLREPALRRPAA